MTSEQTSLIEKYLTDSLNEDEKGNLLYLLNSSEVFKIEFNEALQVKGLIYSALHDTPLVIETMDKVERLDKALENRIMQTIPKRKKASVFKILKITAAAALIFFFFKLSTKQIQTMASIEMAPETIVRRGNGLLSNTAELLVNDIIQTGSIDELISFKDGSKINLKSKSELKLISKSPKVFRLNNGSISAEVTPQDQAMKIETSSAIIEVLGTAFKLSSQEQSSLLKVSKGKVAITDKKTREKVIVSKGEYTIAEGQKLNIQQGNGPLFISDTINSKSSKRYIDIEIDLTGEKQLILVTSNGADNNSQDHTAWLNPVINVNGRWTSLTKLKPKFTKIGSGSLKTFQETQHSDQLMLHGKSYVRGIYAHATSLIIWDLPVGVKMLKCRGAILDTALTKSSNFSAKFEVYSSISKELLDFYLQKKKRF